MPPFKLASLLAMCTAVSACAPDDFIESPEVAKLVQQSLPTVDSELKRFDICKSQADWHLTVEFSDGLLVSYRLTQGEHQAVTRTVASTRVQRELELEANGSVSFGCFGVKRYLTPLDIGGSYVVERSLWGGLTAYITEYRAAYESLEDKHKTVITLGARTVSDAIEYHKTFIPPQNTWGAAF